MVESAQAQTEQSPLEQLDKMFFEVIEKLAQDATTKARECTEEVFHLSSNYLSQDAFETLRKFQNLYEDNVEMNEKKAKISENVDDMFENIQKGLAEGKTTEEISNSIEEDPEAQQLRVGLSGLQKQLEGLITVEDGLKEKLMPAIASMQFEDEVRKRLHNIVNSWRIFTHALNSNQFSPQTISLVIEKSLTSYKETVLFYETVIKEEPPAGSDESIFLEFE